MHQPEPSTDHSAGSEHGNRAGGSLGELLEHGREDRKGEEPDRQQRTGNRLVAQEGAELIFGEECCHDADCHDAD